MQQENGRYRMLAVAVPLLLLAGALCLQLYSIIAGKEYQRTAAGQGRYTVKTGAVYGTIYDSSFLSLLYTDTRYYAVVNPSAEAIAFLTGHACEMDAVYEALPAGVPFVCEVDTSELDTPDLTVLAVPPRYAEKQAAIHLLGYSQNGAGVCGLEAAYSDFLHGTASENIVRYAVNGQGDVLDGLEKEITLAEPVVSGVVTTLDSTIQEICEAAADTIACGAVVVMNPGTGDILAMVSRPVYTVDALGAALENPDAPFINRALSAYSVGSVFKIVTAAAALQSGIGTQFMCECTGVVDISGQIFRCHNRNGHGLQDMKSAMTDSCNPYFITVSQFITPARLRQVAVSFGFGTGITLADGIVAADGNLPDLAALSLPAEQANFSFGQGMLTATPLQVACMTSAVASGGLLPTARLVRGLTTDGKTVQGEQFCMPERILTAADAATLTELLTAAVDGNPDSAARSALVAIAGKTSTAQTGRYDETDTEICHAWMTGFFPADAPEYVVTVFVEDGGSGNTAAAPVFREIAEEITEKITETH